jgi:hypothetical protein
MENFNFSPANNSFITPGFDDLDMNEFPNENENSDSLE